MEKEYVSPEIRVVKCHVEKGFAASMEDVGIDPNNPAAPD